MSMLSTVRTIDLKHFENVKSAFEHISLYVGLVVYTAAGAKVNLDYFSSSDVNVKRYVLIQIPPLQSHI